MIEKIQSVLPVKQSWLMENLLPRIEEERIYRKHKPVEARIAVEGEVITTVTESGEETTNRAGTNDVVVQNPTEAKEQYIVGFEQFKDRYLVAIPLGEKRQTYLPKGKVKAIEVTREITLFLGLGNQFSIEAPWGSGQYCEEGDFLVSPFPKMNEIYRIGCSEFKETYQIDNDR